MDGSWAWVGVSGFLSEILDWYLGGGVWDINVCFF